jgi:Fic family protein
LTPQDLSPLLCEPAKKAELEARNTAAQLDYITYWVNLGARQLREGDVRALHQLAVEDIYPCAGNYRSSLFKVEISDSGHGPPEAARIQSLVIEAVDWCNCPKFDGLTRAAYALWRFNWIHPFAGGNGRTARALTYLVIAMDMGTMPPGSPTIPAAIAEGRGRYLSAIREVDALAKDPYNEKIEYGKPRFLWPMINFVHEILAQQVTKGLLDAQSL